MLCVCLVSFLHQAPLQPLPDRFPYLYSFPIKRLTIHLQAIGRWQVVDFIAVPAVKGIRQHRQVACVASPDVVKRNRFIIHPFWSFALLQAFQILRRVLKCVTVEVELAVVNHNRRKVVHASIVAIECEDCEKI